ncbi:K(+)-transporting ATPase subunit F [Ammonifex degensii]|nr:K(+)-transporting ATPase subunit F [Ammonifex degensii]
MNGWYLAGLIMSFFLFVYLSYVIWNPEKF